MLCGELFNGGFVSAGAVPAVPYSLIGLWIPGCVRATNPRLITSSYLPLLTELLAARCLEEQYYNNYFCKNMDVVRQTQHSNTNDQSSSNNDLDLDLDLDLDNEDSVFLENGLLSFENPNYHLESARFDDALNSNSSGNSLFDELYQDLVVSGARRDEMVTGIVNGSGVGNSTRHARRTYATLDLGSMGVDVTQGPLTQNSVTAETPDNTANHNLGYGSEGAEVIESALVDDNLNGNPRPSSKALSNPSATLDAGGSDHNVRNYCENADNDLTEMGGIPHVEDGLNRDLYPISVKRRQPKDQNITNQLENNSKEKADESQSPQSEDKDENLPAGWEKHEDKDGPYYWHIKSGTIQRETPEATLNSKNENHKSLVKDNDSINNFHSLGTIINTVTRSNTSSALDQELENKRKEELALKRRSYPARADSEGRDKPIRFAVRSLGWTEIAEEDLTPERSSKAVNKCIVDLSLGRNDLLDVVGRWGDGKDLFMDLDEGALKLIDPENLTVLNTQPIHTLRVWGVGRDHGRDFAYVARDRSTRKFMCHVFRCDIPARTIANTLRDICKKIMIERSLHQNLAKPVDINGRTCLATRPTNLPTEHRRFHRNNDQTLVAQSFPTPMEEPKKVLRAQYLGSMQVTAATGMDVLNDAIDHMVTNTPINQWRNVNVAVAPSMISILTPNDEKLITECRVRYLSFLGIGTNVKQCAFIMHTAQDLFIAHIFNCEPSSGALCKTIEAACKLRYQKCLDAHPQGFRNANNLTTPNGRGIGATIKSLVGSLTGRKNKQGES